MDVPGEKQNREHPEILLGRIKERVDEWWAANRGRADNVLLPTDRPSPDAGPRYAYPSWQALQRLSPEERRLILYYFRRLNEARRPAPVRRDP